MSAQMVEREALRGEGGKELACEASEIGLAPGEWPLILRVPNHFGRMGNFERLSIVRDRDGDVQWTAYTYREGHLSVSLRVYND